MAKKFSDLENNILAFAGTNLSESATPYADIAEQAGTDEQTVIELLSRLKDDKIIRRFGATLRHQKAGYGANAMVAWRVEEDQDPEGVGELMAARPEISHCYLRKTYDDWPYNLYTMIHGKGPDDCKNVVKELMEQTGITDHSILRSLKEMKKTSMVYFEQK
ncbi:Lrp/AsnC family transcriptional regulator [Maridesulfovibrio hydrothermalis]|uniref:siroheme decarboxylase n=1 Tax=Maridesulfovibrio hydrothermalis AM13 = DSM 14728 TaxID=1121451 RepID=L0R6U2_9BACT|nr:Lrp/AsnC family transcriptional regulator [Maridesulfovibrio hydrothermalis]CCO22439.1 putative transcriptional regulator, AsnC family [Maridesulfovibrio hydrothermalis AM13 = DSM 14728]